MLDLFFFLHSSISHIAFMLPQSVTCMPEETTVSHHTQKEEGGGQSGFLFGRASVPQKALGPGPLSAPSNPPSVAKG